MYLASILDAIRKNEVGMRQATTPRGLHAPEPACSFADKKAPVTDAHVNTVRQIIKRCVVKHFCGNVVALRKKSEANKSLFTAVSEINVVEAMKATSSASSDFLVEIMRTHIPPLQFKEVRSI